MVVEGYSMTELSYSMKLLGIKSQLFNLHKFRSLVYASTTVVLNKNYQIFEKMYGTFPKM